MLNKFQKLITGKMAFIFLGVIIVLHLSLMFIYLQGNRIAREDAKRDAVIQKIINAIYLVEATPIDNRQHAVSAMDDPVVHATFTQKPDWPLQFKQISFWKISKALRNNLDSFAISIMLNKNQWLNLNATIYSDLFFKQMLMLMGEMLIFGAIFMFVWSINRFTRPLRKFKKAAEQLGIDLHSKPLDIYGPQVVREAALALNKMQERIQDLIRDRTQVLAAISHDLRTPITRMKIRAQFVEDQSLQDNFAHDLEEMQQMINETLSFARQDSHTEDKTHIDLVSLLQAICEDMQDIGQHVEFHCKIDRLAFYGRRLALKRAFTNLINNGIRYGKNVQVSLTQRGKSIWIKVEDDGPGIPEAELKHVFTPFYRGECSRNRDTGGAGLGLAVVNDIIKSHNGKVTLENKNPHGLCVWVYITN